MREKIITTVIVFLIVVGFGIAYEERYKKVEDEGYIVWKASPADWRFIAKPNKVIFQLHNGANIVFDLKTGQVAYPDSVPMDELTKEFWKCMETAFMTENRALRDTIQVLRKELQDLKAP